MSCRRGRGVGPVVQPRWQPGGGLLAAERSRADVRPADRPRGVGGPVTAHGTAFSPDGERLAIVQTEWPTVTRLAPRSRLASVVWCRWWWTPRPVRRPSRPVWKGTGQGCRRLTTAGTPLPAMGVRAGTTAWSPDGRFLATTSADGTVVVSDTATGSRRFAIEAHTAPVNALAWSPDGARLATASDDGTAQGRRDRARRRRRNHLRRRPRHRPRSGGGRVLAGGRPDRHRGVRREPR